MSIDHRLRKLLCLAGHPTTNDNEALIAIRTAYKFLEDQGLSFDHVTTDPVDTYSDARRLQSQIRRIAALEEQLKQARSELADAHHETKNLKEQTKALRRDLRAERKANSTLSAQHVAAVAENAALQAEAAAMRRDKAALTNGIDAKAGTEGLVEALRTLRRINPDMRIKTAIALLVTAASDGLSASELAEQVGETNDASMRYTMRALGEGWLGTRAGHGLVMTCTDPKGGRSRLYLVTGRGRAVRDAVLAALRGASTQGAPEFRMAA